MFYRNDTYDQLNEALGQLGGGLGTFLGATLNKPSPQRFDFQKVKGTLANAGVNKEVVDNLSPEQIYQISDRITQLTPQLGFQGALQQVTRELGYVPQQQPQQFGLPSSQQQSQVPYPLPERYAEAAAQQVPQTTLQRLLGPYQALVNPIARGGKHGGQTSVASKYYAGLKGEGAKDFAERTKLEDPSFIEAVSSDLTRLLADTPIYALGGRLGGTPTAFALHAGLDSLADEYLKYLDDGGKGSIKDFIKSSYRSGKNSLKGGVQGLLFQLVNKANILNKFPTVQKLLTEKGGPAVKKAVENLVNAGVFTGIQGIQQKEIPTIEDYGRNLALFFGGDLLSKAGKFKNSVYNMLKKANIQPEYAAQEIRQIAQKKGYDLNNPNDIVRAVKDVTKEPSKSKEVFQQRVPKDTELRQSPAETSRALAERPIEEYLVDEAKKEEAKSKPLTPRQEASRQVYRDTANEIKGELESINNRIAEVQARIDDPNTTKGARAFHNGSKQRLLNEREKLQRKYEDASDIAEKGKARFREDELVKNVQDRINRLVEESKNPFSEGARKTQEDFAKDQKYIERYEQIANAGKIPPAKYVDTNIKILDAYNKGYRELLSKIDELKSQAKTPKERNDLKALEKTIQDNIKINEAKSNLQKDKRASLEALKGAKGSLVKQNLKGLKPNLKSLQKNFVTVQKRLSDIETKTQKAAEAKYSSKEGLKKLYNLLENGSKEEILKETGLNEQEYQEAKSQGEKLREEVEKELNEEKVNESNKKEFVNKFKDKLFKIFDSYKKKFNKKLAQSVAVTFAIRSINKYFKEEYDFEIPPSVLFFASPGRIPQKVLANGLVILGERLFDQVNTSKYVKKLKNAKSEAEKGYIYQELKDKGYTTKQRDKIRKKAFGS